MVFGPANSPRRWRPALCALAAVLFTSAATFTSTIAAGADGPTRPANPAAPRTESAAPPAAPAGPRGPTESVDLPKGAAHDTSKTEDQKLIDLARRMVDKTPKQPATPVKPVEASAAAPADAAAAAAETANRRSLVHPNDQRPLGPRTPVSAGNDADLPQPAGSPSVVSLLGALGLVIGLIFALRGGLRRILGGAVPASSSPVVQVLSRVAVAPRNHVLLMRVGSRILVVGDSAAGMRTLAQIDQPEEVADLLTAVSSSKTSSSVGGFRQLLAHFNGSYKEPAANEGAEENELHIDRARDQVSGLLGKLRTAPGKGGEA